MSVSNKKSNKNPCRPFAVHGMTVVSVMARAVLISPFLALAGEFHLAVDERTQDYGAFTNMAYWVDGEWSKEGSYIVSSLSSPIGTTHDNRYLRTPATQEAVDFPGGQLVLKGNYGSGKVGVLFLQTGGEGAKISGGVLLKANSRVMASGSGVYALDADMTTTTEDVGTVPNVQPYEANGHIRFFGKILSGTSTKSKASIRLTPYNEDRGNFTVEFADGSLSDYPGQLDLVAFPLKSGLSHSLKVIVGTDTCNGKIYPHRSDGDVSKEVPISFAVRDCDDVFRIATFGIAHTYNVNGVSSTFDYTLANGMAFEFPVDGESGSSGRFIVTGTLRKGYENATNVVIRLVGNPVNATVTNKFATLSVPKSTPLNADNFILDCSMAFPWSKPVLSVEEDGEYSTLYVTVPPIGDDKDVVTLVKSDGTSHSYAPGQGFAFENGASWSDGNVPQENGTYLMAGTNSAAVLVARTPLPSWESASSEPYSFPDGASLRLWRHARIHTQKKSLTFGDLRSYEGVLGKNEKWGTKKTTGIYKLSSANETTINGNITIESGYFSIASYQGQSMRIRSKLHGTGTLAFSGMFVIDWDQSSYYLDAINDDFYGKITTRIAYRDGYVPSYAAGAKADTGHGYHTLWLCDGRNLGADLPEPCADALVLADYVRLAAAGSFTIAAKSNRGVTVDGNAVIQADAQRTVRIETPLTVNGNLYKDGEGVLAIAGAADGAGCIIVTNGVLQVAGRDALKGFAVRFAAGTSFAVEPGIGGRGVDLTETGISLDDSLGGKLPLVEDSAWKDRTTCNADVALFTVRTQDSGTFRAMLPDAPPRFYASTVSVWNEPVDNGDGSTTFSVKAIHCGLKMIIR